MRTPIVPGNPDGFEPLHRLLRVLTYPVHLYLPSLSVGGFSDLNLANVMGFEPTTLRTTPKLE